MPWHLLSYYGLLSAGILTGLVRFGVLSRSNIVLLLLLLVTLLVELFAVKIGEWFHKPYIVYNIFQPVEYTLIASAYHIEIRKKAILYSIVAYVFIAVINQYSWQTDVFSTHMLVVSMVLTSVWALLYFHQLLTVASEVQFTSYALFWSSVGFLLFNASCLFVYGAYNFVNDYLGNEINILFRAVRITANHILYLLITISFLGKQKHT